MGGVLREKSHSGPSTTQRANAETQRSAENAEKTKTEKAGKRDFWEFVTGLALAAEATARPF